MVIEIALGIVLGVVLLALIPLLIAGTVRALRLLVPLTLVATALWFTVSFPTQVFGAIGVFAVLLGVVAAWCIVPGKLAASNLRLAQHLASFHEAFMAALDGKPPYRGLKYLPLRATVTLAAIAAVGTLAAAALVALSIVWQSGA